MEAKCPHCGQLREYVENGDSNPSTPPCCSMAGVNGPAAPFAESLAAGTEPAPTATEETAEQQAGDQTTSDGLGSTIPWEQRRGFLDFQAYWQTTRGILFHPAQSFAQWNPPEEMEGALLFLVIFGSLGQILAQYWVMFVHESITTQLGTAQDWFGFSLFILKAPFLVLLSTLFSAAVIHFFLFLLRGTSEKWSKTFALFAYLSGALACLQLIPVAGVFIAPIWGLVSGVCGLRELHRTTTWRVIAAFLLPLMIMLTLLFCLMLLIVGAGLVALQSFLGS
jgi:hypothetical protein